MEISLIIVLFILFWHWFADFVCQTDWQATNKSKNWTALLSHTLIYSTVFALFSIFILNHTGKFGEYDSSIFFIVTLVFHTIQDYFTSRLNTKLWKEGKVHWFFVSIGFDQWLHYVQLFLTYYYLSN